MRREREREIFVPSLQYYYLQQITVASGDRRITVV
jgi:hypothetical protein